MPSAVEWALNTVEWALNTKYNSTRPFKTIPKYHAQVLGGVAGGGGEGLARGSFL